MTRNKLIDLNNHLFEALERINDDKLEGDKLQEEMNRAKTITTPEQIIKALSNIFIFLILTT